MDRMNENGWTRSLMKKGYSPDNSACEGLCWEGFRKSSFMAETGWDSVLKNFMKEPDDFWKKGQQLYWFQGRDG